MARGDSAHVDDFLEVVAISGMEPTVLVGILHITRPYEAVLQSRGMFYDRVRSELLLVLSESSVEQLLQGAL